MNLNKVFLKENVIFQDGGITTSNVNEEADVSIFESLQEPNYSNDDITSEYLQEEGWQAITPERDKALGFLWALDTYTFTTSDGTTITLENLDGVEVYQNAETGEIVVIGAKNAVINGSNENLKINIYDSSISELNLGKGNDRVNIENSTIEEVSGSKGNDTICVENSTITEELSSGAGDDYIYSSNSNIFSVDNGDGDDNIFLDSSLITNVDMGKGNDVAIINESNISQNFLGGKGTDLISSTNSSVNSIDGGKDIDSIILENSTANIINYKEDNVKNVKKEEQVSPYELYSEDTVTESQNITNSKIASYSSKELTAEEQIQALTIDLFITNLENMNTQFLEQENEDGVISDAYNFVKQLLDLGISKEDIKVAIEEQEQMIREMKNSLNGIGDETFEEVFKRWTGMDYNQDNITEYYETAQLYSLAMTGLSKTETFKENISSADSLGQVFNYYVVYYGSEDLAREKLNEFLKESFESEPYAFGFQTVYINENNQFVATYPKEYTPSGPLSGTEYSTTIRDINDVTNMINTMSRYFNIDTYTQEYVDNFEDTMGYSIKELQENFIISQLEAFGSGSSFQKLIDKYCADQEGFTEKLATVTQITGIGLMIIGGVVSFVCPPVGMSIMTAGKWTAVAGMFSDNALEIIDDLSSENGLSKEETWDLLKETLTEVALLYSGGKINGVATSAKQIVLTSTQSKALAFLAEIGTDASLSLLTDLMITGEIDLTGEGISQLLGILTGVAGAKVDAYTKQAFDEADILYKAGDYSGALKLLNGKGIPEYKINNYYRQQDIDRITSIFKETGSVQKALEALKSSKFLSNNDINNLAAELKLDVLKNNGVDISKYQGYDFSSDQGKLVFADIEMYYKSITQGININDLMVPTVKSIENGLQSAKVGDIFEVEGSKKIYIKNPDGSYTQLNISKDTYCKLFPAIDRYSSGQQNSGDCYLVSALNSLFANQSAREQLLKCFSENEDGSVTVKLPNSDTEIIIKGGQTINDLGVNRGKHVTGALGMQLLEYAYKVDLVNKEINKVQESIDFLDKCDVDTYNEYLDSLPEGSEALTFDEFQTSIITSYDNFRLDFKNLTGNDIIPKQIDELIQFTDFNEGIFFTEGKLNQKGYNYLSKITGIPKTEIEKLDEVFSVIMNETQNSLLFDYHIVGTRNYFKLEHQEKIDMINSNQELFETLGGNGGYSSTVFETFGFKNSHNESVSSSDFLNMILNDPSLQDNYLVTAGTVLTKQEFIKRCNDPNDKNYQYYKDNPDAYKERLEQLPDESVLKKLNIVSGHAYGFQVRVNATNGETEIVVTNPWSIANSNNKDIILAVEEFKKYFDTIFVAEIE